MVYENLKTDQKEMLIIIQLKRSYLSIEKHHSLISAIIKTQGFRSVRGGGGGRFIKKKSVIQSLLLQNVYISSLYRGYIQEVPEIQPLISHVVV